MKKDDVVMSLVDTVGIVDYIPAGSLWVVYGSDEDGVIAQNGYYIKFFEWEQIYYIGKL